MTPFRYDPYARYGPPLMAIPTARKILVLPKSVAVEIAAAHRISDPADLEYREHNQHRPREKRHGG